jgi:hypothetical protein
MSGASHDAWIEGIDLRDYFAAKALPAFQELRDKEGGVISFSEAAEWAYEQADAMMREREK